MTLCTNWVEPADLADCNCPDDAAETVVTSAITAASEWIYNASGRRWSGTCTTTERPCGCGCGCTVYDWWDQSVAWTHYYHGLPGRNFGLCTCTSQPIIELTYGPIIGTPTVTIGGAGFADFSVVPPNRLLRTDGNAWPTCQDYTSAATGMLVTYTHGATPPELGKLAAADLAAEIINSCTGNACALPSGTVNVTRRNISIRLDPEEAARTLARVAMFLNAYPTQTTQPDVRRPRQRGLITSGPA